MESPNSGDHALGLALAFGSSALHAAADVSQKALASAMPSMQAALAVKAGMTASALFLAFLLTEEDAWGRAAAALGRADFRAAVAVSGGINAAASWLYLKGLRRGQLVDTLPFLSLTPALLLASGYALLGELPSAEGLLGVLLISLGGFWLARAGAAASAPGARGKEPDAAAAATAARGLPPGTPTFMLIALLYSVSSAFDKRGVQAAPPLVYGTAVNSLVVLVASASSGAGCSRPRPKAEYTDGPSEMLSAESLVACRRRHLLSSITGRWDLLTLWWVLSTASYWCQLEANRRILASHLSAIRRAGVLVAVLLGRALFGEEVRRRLPPIWVMVVGVVLVSMK